MKDDTNTIVFFLILVSGFLVVLNQFNKQVQDMEERAIQAKCADYNSESGEFQWIIKEQNR